MRLDALPPLSERLLLDSMHAGKTMAGLIAYIRAGDYARRDHVVVIHTGDLPGLFPHAAVFA